MDTVIETVHDFLSNIKDHRLLALFKRCVGIDITLIKWILEIDYNYLEQMLLALEKQDSALKRIESDYERSLHITRVILSVITNNHAKKIMGRLKECPKSDYYNDTKFILKFDRGIEFKDVYCYNVTNQAADYLRIWYTINK